MRKSRRYQCQRAQLGCSEAVRRLLNRNPVPQIARHYFQHRYIEDRPLPNVPWPWHTQKYDIQLYWLRKRRYTGLTLHDKSQRWLSRIYEISGPKALWELSFGFSFRRPCFYGDFNARYRWGWYVNSMSTTPPRVRHIYRRGPCGFNYDRMYHGYFFYEKTCTVGSVICFGHSRRGGSYVRWKRREGFITA